MILCTYNMNEATGHRPLPPPTPPKDNVQEPRLVDKDQPVREIVLGKEIVSSSSQIAAGVLHIEDNEDGPPIAARLKQKGKVPMTILSVTDGLGGQIGHVREFVNKSRDRLHTGSWIGAQTASKAVRNLYESMQEGTIPDTTQKVKNLLTQKLKERFELTRKQFTQEHIFENPRRHPTTLTTVLIAEKIDSNLITIFKKGNSPVFIMTADETIVVEKPSHENPYVAMGDTIYQDHYDLESARIEMSKYKPFLVITGSNGLIKMANGDVNLLRRAIYSSFTHTEGKNLSDTIPNLKKYYDKQECIPDDTTISMATFGVNQSPKEWVKTWIYNPKITRIKTK
jgi:hypothetical protein